MLNTKLSIIRKLIREAIAGVLDEIDIEDIKQPQDTKGSTHVMKTFKLDDDDYYLKFSRENPYGDDGDPSMQVLVEYLAYQIYKLYDAIKIPSKIELVYDKKNDKVGIATSSVKGQMALPVMSAKALGKAMSAGVFVDIFLANWDVIGMDTGNVMVSDDKVITRIDPGGSLSYRAQGSKKGSRFSKKAGELTTMLDPSMYGGSGIVFQHSDMKQAAKVFLAVPWATVANTIKSTMDTVESELMKRGMFDRAEAWTSEATDIMHTLGERHKDVSAQAKQIG